MSITQQPPTTGTSDVLDRVLTEVSEELAALVDVSGCPWPTWPGVPLAYLAATHRLSRPEADRVVRAARALHGRSMVKEPAGDRSWRQ